MPPTTTAKTTTSRNQCHPHGRSLRSLHLQSPFFRRRRFLFLVIPLTSSLLLVLQNYQRSFVILSSSSSSSSSSLFNDRLMGLAPPVIDRDESRNGGRTNYDINDVGLVSKTAAAMEEKSSIYDVFDTDDDTSNDEVDDDDDNMVDDKVNDDRDVDGVKKSVAQQEDKQHQQQQELKGQKKSSATTPADFWKMMNKARIKQNPKGTKWKGWYAQNTIPTTDSGAGDAGNAGTTNEYNTRNNNNNNDNNNWWRTSQMCFEVTHICHYQRNANPRFAEEVDMDIWEQYLQGLNEWFYYTPLSSSSTTTAATTAADVFQPTMELKGTPYKYDKGTWGERRISIKVKSPSSIIAISGEIVEGQEEEGDDNETTSRGRGYYTSNDFKFLDNDTFLLRKKKINDNGGGGSGSSTIDNNGADSATCHISPTQTHIVLQNAFNDMIGEFYARTLLKLFTLMTRNSATMPSDDGNNSTTNANNDQVMSRQEKGNANRSANANIPPWEQDIQFYVHLAYANKQLLDGHKLLLNSMLSSPGSKDAKSFLEFFVEKDEKEKNEEDGSGSSTSNSGGGECQCYKKMVFCGYNVYVQDEDASSNDEDDDNENGDDEVGDVGEDADDDTADQSNNTGGDDDDVDDDGGKNTNNDDGIDETVENKEETTTLAATENAINSSNSLGLKANNAKYTLWPTSSIDLAEDRSCSLVSTDINKCQGWKGLRYFLLSNIEKHYPTVKEDLVHHRKNLLLEKGLISESYKGDTKEWTIVGLAQRTYRRSWINLPDVLKACNEISPSIKTTQNKQVVCVEINVEKTSSPYEQVLLHRSLDALIGVHGAQLTQAILLPRHAHILELLPWVPDYARGKWVQKRTSPTPLGIIYHNTDLNHLGYSLDRDSVPLCKNAKVEDEQKCFMNKRNRKYFVWESRNFNVNPDVILQYITNFVLSEKRECNELKNALDNKFVLYNVWCAKDDDNVDSGQLNRRGTLSAGHYYDEDPVGAKRKNTGKKIKKARKKRKKKGN